MRQVEAYERNQEILSHFESKCGELRSVFALADPANHKPREIPDHLVDMV
jgi:STIP1 family protein 1